MLATTTQSNLDVGDIFKNYIRIEPKVMAIETLFNNQRRFDRTNYKPPYQRNYVWTDEKATYFIESILLGTEIPPLIFFNSSDKTEVIDGRQRYETIYRFVNNHFKLTRKGLLILKDLANKNFDGLKDLKDTIWDTKLRIIEFSFHTKPESEYDVEDIVKKEIFKRYNTGITPLKPTEIDKAKYIDDDLNTYIKEVLQNDRRVLDLILSTFYFDNSNIEFVLKQIRQLLILHRIPINYYAVRGQEVISKFYELLSEGISTKEEIEHAFNGFLKKVYVVNSIKNLMLKRGIDSNRLVFECIYWGLSVLENEGFDLSQFDNSTFKNALIKFIQKNINKYNPVRSLFCAQIIERYSTTASFFQSHFNISLSNYTRNNESFTQLNKSLSKNKTKSGALLKFESLRLNKPDASSNSIEDICRLMKRQRFMIRPVYQRKEVINKNKSSSIIESILLGIKLPPIFVFKREDGVSEVVDGQQRLLSILGYLGRDYLDENKNLVRSVKDNYSLSLQNSILRELHRKKFTSLGISQQDKILDYNLWVIEIDEKNNPGFDPIDLFIRLNYKPYPIKENTFEMWNSYVDRNIINKVKEIYNRNAEWFYLRKNNSRMDNEGLIMTLIYLQHKLQEVTRDIRGITTFLDIYKSGDKINVRIKSKNDITKVIDSPESAHLLINTCNNFEEDFIAKVKALLGWTDNNTRNLTLRLDALISAESSQRTNQSFYALWMMLSNVSLETILDSRVAVRQDIIKLFNMMKKTTSKTRFEQSLQRFWKNYR